MNRIFFTLVIVLVMLMSSVCFGQTVSDFDKQLQKMDTIYNDMALIGSGFDSDDCWKTMEYFLVAPQVTIFSTRTHALIPELALLNRITGGPETPLTGKGAEARIFLANFLEEEIAKDNKQVENMVGLMGLSQLNGLSILMDKFVGEMRETIALKVALRRNLINIKNQYDWFGFEEQQTLQ